MEEVKKLSPEEKEKQKEKERLAKEKEKQKEKEKLAKEKEKQKEKERLAKEKEKQKEKERLAKEKEKQKEKEKLAKEKEKQKEKEKLAKEKEKQKEKEKLAKEKEKQKEKEKLAKEKEKQKEKLAKEKEKQKEKEKLAKEKEKQKEKEKLAKENLSSTLNLNNNAIGIDLPKKPIVLTPKEGVEAKPLVSRVKNNDSIDSDDVRKVDEVKNIDLSEEISEDELQKIKEYEISDSLNKMQSVVQAREKLNNPANFEKEPEVKEGKIKLGKISLNQDSQDPEELALLKSRASAQKALESELMVKKDSEIQNKLKEASLEFEEVNEDHFIGDDEDSDNKEIELDDSRLKELLDKITELNENIDVLNDALDYAEKIEYDGIKIFDSETFEMSKQFKDYLEGMKSASSKVEELEIQILKLLSDISEYKKKEEESKNQQVVVEDNNESVDNEDEVCIDNSNDNQDKQDELSLCDSNVADVDKQDSLEEKNDSLSKDNNIEISFEEIKPVSFFKKVLNFFVDSFNGMAYGLFATLIIGVIFEQIFKLLVNIDFFKQYEDLFNNIQTGVKLMMGVGIGLGIANGLKLDGLKLICATVAGGLAAYLYSPDKFGAGANPLTIYFVVIATVGAIKLLFKKKTPIDIVLIPLITIIVASIANQLLMSPIDAVMNGLSSFIKNATALQPLAMGIVIAVVMGMCLTAPISSAAIAISIGLDGIAGGAALVGCCVQMLGFAVMSRKDNNIGKVLSIGIGTSMLEFKNILKKPIIWLPTIIVSAILGPISTVIFKIETTKVGAGMGTSGLVGILQTFDVMGYSLHTWVLIIGFLIVLPIILVWIVDIIFRSLKLIKKGDLEI